MVWETKTKKSYFYAAFTIVVLFLCLAALYLYRESSFYHERSPEAFEPRLYLSGEMNVMTTDASKIDLLKDSAFDCTSLNRTAWLFVGYFEWAWNPIYQVNITHVNITSTLEDYSVSWFRLSIDLPCVIKAPNEPRVYFFGLYILRS